MTTQLTLADRSGQALAQHHIAHGQTLRIAAQSHTQYRLLDPQSGQAPDYVQLLRQGDDLHILIREDGTLILDNYYAIDPGGTLTPVLGAQADGQWLAYPHNPDIPHLLAGEIATPTSHAPPDITPLAGILGIAAVGGIGAAIAGRRSETHLDNPGFLPDQPQSPFDPNQPTPPAPNPPAPNPPAPNPPAPNPPAPNPPAPNPPAPNPPAPNPPAPNPPAPNPPAPNPPAPNPPAPNPPAPNPPAPNPPAPNPPAPNPPAPNPPAPNPPAPNPPVNHAPTGAVVITGEATVGKTLTASNTLQDEDGLGQITYKWFADGVHIGTGDSYTLTAAEKGKTVTVKAEYIDGKGNAESAESAATAPVDDTYLLREDFSGYAIGSDYSAEGGTFGPWTTVFHGNGHVKIIDRGNGNHALELAPAAIAADQSKTAATLVVGPDTGSHFEYSGTFATAEQLRTNDAPNAWETSWIVWGYQDPEHFYYFIPKANGWELGKRDPAYKGGLNNVGGQRFLATGSEPVFTPESLKHFTVTQNGNMMRISINGRDIVTFEDNESPYTGGKIGIYTEDARINADDLTLRHIAPDTLPPNMHDGQITLEGEAKVGATLIATVADADGVPADGIHYIWYADKVRIAGADGATFVIPREYLGKHISVQAMYTDRAGTGEAPVSADTAAIVDSIAPPAANNPPTGNVSIIGETQVGKTLTASNTLKDEDGLGTITYKWFADGVEVGQGDTYTIQAQDKGKTITVKAEYTDGKGHAESVESTPAPAVTDPIAPPSDGAPTIRLSGAAEVTEGSSATYRVDLDLSALGKPANAADLLDKLARTPNILFGHQHGLDVSVTPPNAAGYHSDVYAMTGRYPAVIGLDADEWPVDHTKTPQENGKALAERFKDIDNVGGIATLSAHWNNPASGGDAFDKTPVALTRILPGGDLHGKYAVHLDTVAEIARASVRADGSKIPIIFRPLHENTGDWFWWGKQNFTAEEFKTLWQYSVDYLRGKGADNLLYAFSPNGHFDGDAGRYLETYPGDDYVDIFGYDVYLNSLAQDRSQWMADTVQDLAMLTRLAASHGKVAAFSEFGMNGEYTLKPGGNPYPTFYTDLLKAIQADPDAAKIAYMLTWANFNDPGNSVPWPGHEMEGDFKAFAQELLLGKAADRDITVEIEVEHRTTDDGDLKISTQQITIPKGYSGAGFTIDALADGKAENDETYRVRIKNAQGGTIDAAHDAADTVIHDDGKAPPPAAGELQLSHDSSKSYWLDEGQGGAVVGTLSVKNGDSTAYRYHVSDERFEIAGDTLKLKDGQSVNYDTEKRIILTVTATDHQGAELGRDFAVQVKDDSTYQSSFAFALPENTGGAITVPDAPMLAHDAGGIRVTPADNADTLHLRYQDAQGKTHLVDMVWNKLDQIWQSSDSSIRPQQYERSITLAAQQLKAGGSVWASNAAQGVYADDNARIVVGSGQAATLENSNNATNLEAYLYAANRSAVTEGGRASYIIRLNRAADEDLTFNIALIHKDSDAADASLSHSAVTIPKGRRHAVFSVEMHDDTAAESTETYKIAISAANGKVGIPASRASLTGEIRDNDHAAPTFDDTNGVLTYIPAAGAKTMSITYSDKDFGVVSINTWQDGSGYWHISAVNPDKRSAAPTVDGQSGVVTLPDSIMADGGFIRAEHNDNSVSASGRNTAVAEYQGWTLDWHDTFGDDLSVQNWTTYGWGWQAPEYGGMGRYYQSNAFARDGALHLRSQYHDGEWSSAGVSSSEAFSAVGGRWEIRARFPDAKGIGYAFLLWPKSENWPPEIDFAEGRVRDPNIMATYHWGSVDNHMQDNRFLQNEDLTDWHTYGAIVDPVAQTITYTFDGKPWFTLKDVPVTDEALWIGFQSGAQDPLGSFAQYESIDHAIPGKDTPAVSDIEIDWVAHYRPEGAPKILAPLQLNLDYATAADDGRENTAAPLTVGDVLTDSDTLALDNLLGAPANNSPTPISPSVADSVPLLPVGDPIRWIDIQNGTEIL